MGTNKNSCKTAAVMKLLGQSQTAGPVVDGQSPAMTVLGQQQAARDIEVITSEILDAKRRAGENILTIGRGLIEAKAMLSHGEWLPWLTERVEFSEKSAQNFMRIAQNYSNPQALADLGATKALMLLALPQEVRGEFMAEPHLVNGEEKTVIDMTSRELQAALKERDEALKAAEQARAEQTAAEQARERMAQDMAVANERIAGLNAEVEQRAAEARDRADEAARLEKELEELRSRPVDVAVQVDEEAVAAARREAEEKTRLQVEKELKFARKAAQEQVITANEAAAQAKTKLEQAERELKDLRFEAARAEKRAMLASDANLVLLRELLDQFQEIGNKMNGVLMKVRNKDPKSAQSAENAICSACENIKEGAKG